MNANRKDTLFIDASLEFTAAKSQKLLGAAQIEKIVAAYKDRTELEKYSHLVSAEEFAENDFNLIIPRYVDTVESEEEIDIVSVQQEIVD